MLRIKNRLNTGFDLLKLCSFTSVCTLIAIPMSMAINPGVYGDALSAFLLPIGFEIFFFAIFVLPPSLGLMGIAYLVTKRRDKRIENVGHGYIVGFIVGLLLVILVISPVGALLGLPVIGFCVGLVLSFVSSRRENKTRFDSVKGSLLD
ncbi:MAG TPA: hypothetical protein VJP79_09400 [Nitrososphaera sp.]|nr:hypothetical protein [Nitrososphaera sp.]